MANPMKAAGSTLAVQISAAYQTIPRTQSINGSSRVKTTIGTDYLGTVAAEHLAGSYDNGEYTFTVQYDPTDVIHAYLDALFETGDETQGWKRTFSDGSTETFIGTLTEFQVTDQVLNQLTLANGKIKVNGTITRA